MMIKRTIITFLGILLLNSCLEEKEYVPIVYTIRVYIVNSENIPIDDLELKTLKLKNINNGKSADLYTHNSEGNYYEFTGLKDAGNYDVRVEIEVDENIYHKNEPILLEDNIVNIKKIRFDGI